MTLALIQVGHQLPFHRASCKYGRDAFDVHTPVDCDSIGSLTDADVHRIEKLGVSYNSVRFVQTEKTWKNVK